MAHFNSIKDKNLNELLRLVEEKNRNGERSDQVRFTIMVRSVEFIAEALEKMTESNTRLSEKIFWLNIVLTGATVVAACVAILNFICK